MINVSIQIKQAICNVYSDLIAEDKYYFIKEVGGISAFNANDCDNIFQNIRQASKRRPFN